MCSGLLGPFVLCNECTLELWPTWFWWKDVPVQYRADKEWINGYVRPGNRLKYYRIAARPNRCLAAVLDNASARKWRPCGRPSADGRENLCKVHAGIYDRGAWPSGLQTKWHKILATRDIKEVTE